MQHLTVVGSTEFEVRIVAGNRNIGLNEGVAFGTGDVRYSVPMRIMIPYKKYRGNTL